MQHQTVVRGDVRYPERLRKLSESPDCLYYRGQWEDSLFSHCLTVVGTRRITSYGKQMTEALVGPIAAAGVTIVSGFMFGVDAAAQRVAVAVGGRTIAVIPCGIERVPPPHQKRLYGQVLKKGLVVSEYSGTGAAASWTMSKRNRIVAGLSQATLVIEGTEQSGSLLTATLARQYGRQIFAVPGPVTSPVSLGPIQLLRGGAAVAARAEDVLSYYGKSLPQTGHCKENRETATDPSSVEGRVLKRLGQEAFETDGLARVLRLSPAVVAAALTLLQLRGQVIEQDGRYTLGLPAGRIR